MIEEILHRLEKIEEDIEELKKEVKLMDTRTVQTDYKLTKINENMCQHITDIETAHKL